MATMSKGPWLADFFDKGYVMDCDGNYIAECPMADSEGKVPDGETVQANTQAIAQLPELVALARDVRDGAAEYDQLSELAGKILERVEATVDTTGGA